jgi:hypothetical protein
VVRLFRSGSGDLELVGRVRTFRQGKVIAIIAHGCRPRGSRLMRDRFHDLSIKLFLSEADVPVASGAGDVGAPPVMAEIAARNSPSRLAEHQHANACPRESFLQVPPSFFAVEIASQPRGQLARRHRDGNLVCPTAAE